VTRSRSSLARLGAATGLAAWATVLAAQGTDADVVAAKAAYERGDRVRLDAAAPRAKGHVLEPYVAYWQLKVGLDTAEPDAVRAEIARLAGTPLAERATADWLRVLGKRGDWTRFAAFHVAGTYADDVEITCYAHQAARSRDGDAALAAAKPLWFTGQATPDACEPLFAALAARGTLTLDDRWARYRLALEAGSLRLAQQVAGDLPTADRIDARDFRRVDAKPAAELAQGAFRWKFRDGRELALFAPQVRALGVRLRAHRDIFAGCHRHRARDQRGAQRTFGREQCPERQRRRHLRTVEQRKPFLGRKLERREPRLAKRFPAGERP